MLLMLLLLLPEGTDLLLLPRLHRTLRAEVAEATFVTQSAAIRLFEVICAWLALTLDVFGLMRRPLRLERLVLHVRGCRSHHGLARQPLVKGI